MRLRGLAVLLLAAGVLALVAIARGAEYDEQYTLFLTAGVARPVWPDGVFPAGVVRAIQSGHAGLGAIARDLRAGDVHPPLYFWSVALWRRVAGDGLLAARMFSVVCGVGALAAVGMIARRVAVPPALAMLLTLGCYGFAYTGGIARGFMLAQALLLWGLAALLCGGRWRSVTGGVLLGAACFANYLAVFVALAAWAVACWPRAGGGVADTQGAPERVYLSLLPRCAPNKKQGRPSFPSWQGLTRPSTPPDRASSPLPQPDRPCVDGRIKPGHDEKVCGARRNCSFIRRGSVAAGRWPTRNDRGAARRDVRGSALALVGMAPFLLADAWFFLAQRDSRTGQFAAFHWLDALPRLARCAAAAWFGGLPLYAHGTPQLLVVAALVLLGFAAILLVGARFRHRGLLCITAALPVGLLGLGFVFDTTPIEIRYLAVACPLAALLLAGALATLPRRVCAVAASMLLLVQAASLAGLMTRAETMQPARATAAAATAWRDGGIVLLPRGNDGVGVVGAYGIEAPPDQPILVLRADASRADILQRVGTARRVVIARMAQDDSSRALQPRLIATFAEPCWQRVADTPAVVVFWRVPYDGCGWN